MEDAIARCFIAKVLDGRLVDVRHAVSDAHAERAPFDGRKLLSILQVLLGQDSRDNVVQQQVRRGRENSRVGAESLRGRRKSKPRTINRVCFGHRKALQQLRAGELPHRSSSPWLTSFSGAKSVMF